MSYKELLDRIHYLEEKVDSLETTRDRILGAISLISFLAPIAITCLLQFVFELPSSGIFSKLASLF